MDEGRKRVLGIMAAIFASLHMQTALNSAGVSAREFSVSDNALVATVTAPTCLRQRAERLAALLLRSLQGVRA